MNSIASERKRAGITQAQLAEKIGVDEKTISRWERDDSSIPSRKACEMASIFKCSIDYLFGLTDERTVKGGD